MCRVDRHSNIRLYLWLLQCAAPSEFIHMCKEIESFYSISPPKVQKLSIHSFFFLLVAFRLCPSSVRLLLKRWKAHTWYMKYRLYNNRASCYSLSVGHLCEHYKCVSVNQVEYTIHFVEQRIYATW